MKKNLIKTFALVLIIVMSPIHVFAVNEDFIPIDIDGYYDDWTDKPHTDVYNGNNPPASKINKVSLFRDEDNIYVHVIFAQKNNQDITNMTIDIFTNLGDESYFLLPDSFWFDTDMNSFEPQTLTEEGAGTESNADQSPAESPDLTAPENQTAPEDLTAPEDQTAPENQSAPETTEPEPAATESSDTEEQNILAGHEVPSYVLVADNDKNDPAEAPAATGSDTTTVTTDEKTNNGQGNGSGNNGNAGTEPGAGDAATVTTDENTGNGQGNDSQTSNGQGNETDVSAPDTGTESGIGTEPADDANMGDFLNILNPDNLVDLDNVLDQFSPDEATDASVPDDSADLNSNLNLKKPGWYGTWGFTVWDHHPVGYGYYTRAEGEPDELELYIPLSSINHHYDGITEISMKIKKLGKQEIVCTGVSSGAYLGVAMGAGIVMLSVGAYTYKKKWPFVLNKGK